MAGEDDLSDPKLILVIVYGMFVMVLFFFCGSRLLMCKREGCPLGHSQVTTTADSENESDGIIYELLSAKRKNEIDALRHSIFCRILSNFSLMLRNEHMLRRDRSKPLDKTGSNDEVQKDVEEGLENEANEPLDKGNSSESEGKALTEFTHIVVPLSGTADNDNPNIKTTREVPIFCAICLSEYAIDDEVCWSSNSNCTHVFHRECVVQWLVALGRRKSTMQRFPDTPSEKRLLNYELECPCCRQDFVLPDCVKVEA